MYKIEKICMKKRKIWLKCIYAYSKNH